MEDGDVGNWDWGGGVDGEEGEWREGTECMTDS